MRLIDVDVDAQIKEGFGKGKDLFVTFMSAIGEEPICGLKDIGPMYTFQNIHKHHTIICYNIWRNRKRSHIFILFYHATNVYVTYQN